MTSGVYYDLPMPDYLAAPGVSNSALSWLAVSPAHYLAYTSGRIKDDPTKAQLFGTAGHARILQGVEPDWIVEPATYPPDDKPWSNNAKYCKQWHAEQTKPVVKAWEDEMHRAVFDAIKRDPRAQTLLARGRPEVSIFAEYDGIAMKGRLDWFAEDIIVDLKILADASTEWLQRAIYDRRYHVQLATYYKLAHAIGFKPSATYIIAVEKSDPPMVNVRKLSDRAMEVGVQELDLSLQRLRSCQASGDWYGYSGEGTKIHDLDLPEWVYARAGMNDLELTVNGVTERF